MGKLTKEEEMQAGIEAGRQAREETLRILNAHPCPCPELLAVKTSLDELHEKIDQLLKAGKRGK